MLPQEKRKNISLEEKAEQATTAVWKKLLKEHKKTGEPIISWRDGRVVYLSPYNLKEIKQQEYLAVNEEQAEYEQQSDNPEKET